MINGHVIIIEQLKITLFKQNLEKVNTIDLAEL